MALNNEDRAKVIALAKAGARSGEIAKQFGVTLAVVCGVLFRERAKTIPPVPRPAPIKQPPRPGAIRQDIQPAKYPFAPDNTCPDFAWDEDHCSAVNAAGGFGVLPLKRRA